MYRLEEITELLRKIARRYVLTSNTIRYRIEYRCIVSLLLKVPGPYDVLVDLGAGSGEMSAGLVERGFAKQGLAVEPDAVNFKRLMSRYAKLKQCRCLNTSIESAALDPGSADLILCTQVLEHIADDNAAVARIAELIAPRGIVLISVPHPPEIFPNPGHFRPGYTRESLTGLFQEHGFQFIDHDYFFVISTLRRLVAAQKLGRVGQLFPVWWADREANLSTAEKAKEQPYGLAALFQKR